MAAPSARAASANGSDDGGERVGVEAGAPHQRPIHFRLRKQLAAVVGLHAPSVEYRRAPSLIRVPIADQRPHEGHRVLGLPWRSDASRADGPDRFIGDEHLVQALRLRSHQLLLLLMAKLAL